MNPAARKSFIPLPFRVMGLPFTLDMTEEAISSFGESTSPFLTETHGLITNTRALTPRSMSPWKTMGSPFNVASGHVTRVLLTLHI